MGSPNDRDATGGATPNQSGQKGGGGGTEETTGSNEQRLPEQQPPGQDGHTDGTGNRGTVKKVPLRVRLRQAVFGTGHPFSTLPKLGYALFIPYAVAVYSFIDGVAALAYIALAELALAALYMGTVYNDRKQGTKVTRLWYLLLGFSGGTVLTAPVFARLYLRRLTPSS